MSTTLRFTVGIDLGSTTTKAVVLGMDETVLGRGITNSRSNYEVACNVALGEALINTRFSLIANELSSRGMQQDVIDDLLEEFALRFKEQQYRSQLAALANELSRDLTATTLGAA